MTAFIGSPLPYPLFSIVNTLIGVFIFFLVAGLGVFYTNTWWVQYLPIASVSDIIAIMAPPFYAGLLTHACDRLRHTLSTTRARRTT